MFNREFILIIERWLVAPLIGLLIIHGLVNPKDSGWLTTVVDQFLGTGFIIVAYIVTHHHAKTTTTTEIISTGDSMKLWDRIKGFILTKTTTTETTETPQP